MGSPGIGDVKLGIVWAETKPVWLEDLIGDLADFSGLRVYSVNRFLLDRHHASRIRSVSLVVHQTAITGIRKPNPPVRMHHDVIGRVEFLPAKTIGQDGRLAITFIPDDSPVPMFAGKLPPLEVKGVSIAVSTGLSKVVHPAIVLNPSQLAIIGNVAPDQVLSYAVPSRPLGPKHVRTGIYSADGCIAQTIFPESRIQDQNVGIGVTRRVGSRPIPGIQGTHGCADA